MTRVQSCLHCGGHHEVGEKLKSYLHCGGHHKAGAKLFTLWGSP